jgi:formate dehydrogenase subunit gamma
MNHDSAAIARCVSSVVARFKEQPGPLLEILHAVQDDLGYVPPDAVPLIADALNLSRAEVHGVVSFYHHFHETPFANNVLKLCRAEACQSMNGNAIADLAKRRLGCDFGATRADGRLTLEAVYCLGLCACAPAAMFNGRPLGRIDAARIEEVAIECGAHS